LYQSDPDPAWFAAATTLAEDMLANYADANGGFFDTRHDQGQSIARPKEIQDNATPSGNALAALALLRLAAYTERTEWVERVEPVLCTTQDLMVRHPTAFACWLQAADLAIGPIQQIALIGPRFAPEALEMVDQIWCTYRPRSIFAATTLQAKTNGPGLLRERGMIQGKPTVYVCEGFTCQMPVTEPLALRQQLDA
jgi:uncharacterized protein YyaL (SSP411 family)